MATTQNKLITTISSNNNAITAFLDTAAELSKIDRKNHHQVTEQGKSLVYDLMITVSTPSTSVISSPDKQILMAGTVLTAPNNWQTRNAVRMANFTRNDLRREAGVSKKSIGKYAKTMRLNLDRYMHGIEYNPAQSLASRPEDARYQRLYACHDPDSLPAYMAGGQYTGGVWDYTQLAQVETDDANAATDYHLTVLGTHQGSPASGYTTVSCIEAYNQRRQTVLDDSTVTPGGDTQFIDNDSPFFRVPQQDVSEDLYVQITLDEQDNPPYDRTVDGDSVESAPSEYFQLTAQNTMTSFRVQAPLGLVQFEFTEMYGSGFTAEPPVWGTVQDVIVEVECLGTYEM